MKLANYILVVMFGLFQIATLVADLAGRGMVSMDTGSSGTSVLINMLFFVFLVIVIALNFFRIRRQLDGIATVFILMGGYLILCSLQYFSYSLKDWLRAAIMPCFAPFFFLAMYSLCREIPKVKVFILNFYVILFGINVLAFFAIYKDSTAYAMNSTIMEAYSVFLFYPWLLAYNLKLFRYFFIVLIAVITVYSGKRGAFLNFVVATPIYIFIQDFIVERRYRLFYIASIPVFLLLLGYATYHWSGDTLDFLISRLDSIGDDGGSGRFEIWEITWDAYQGTNLMGKIFGEGYYAATSIISAYGTHNDPLQYLYSYGVVGFIFQVLILWFLLKRAYQLIRSRSEFAAAFTAGVIIYFIMINISSIYFSPRYPASIFSFFGFVFAYTHPNTLGVLTAQNQFHGQQHPAIPRSGPRPEYRPRWQGGVRHPIPPPKKV